MRLFCIFYFFIRFKLLNLTNYLISFKIEFIDLLHLVVVLPQLEDAWLFLFLGSSFVNIIRSIKTIVISLFLDSSAPFWSSFLVSFDLSLVLWCHHLYFLFGVVERSLPFGACKLSWTKVFVIWLFCCFSNGGTNLLIFLNLFFIFYIVHLIFNSRWSYLFLKLNSGCWSVHEWERSLLIVKLIRLLPRSLLCHRVLIFTSWIIFWLNLLSTV